LGITNEYGNVGDLASWSPNGDKIAFGACRRGDMGHPQTCQILLAVPRVHTVNDISEIYYNSQTGIAWPAWSPDGLWIAFVAGPQLEIIKASGTNRQVLDAYTQAAKPTWSPDSQSLAWVGKSTDGKSTQVWMLDRTSGKRKLLFVDDVRPAQPEKTFVAWGPDGKFVFFADEAGQTWSIKRDCLPAANGGCSPADKPSEFPRHWLPDFFPQWAGEKVNR
jgi:Tol biopolymer transport system component